MRKSLWWLLQFYSKFSQRKVDTYLNIKVILKQNKGPSCNNKDVRITIMSIWILSFFSLFASLLFDFFLVMLLPGFSVLGSSVPSSKNCLFKHKEKTKYPCGQMKPSNMVLCKIAAMPMCSWIFQITIETFQMRYSIWFCTSRGIRIN